MEVVGITQNTFLITEIKLGITVFPIPILGLTEIKDGNKCLYNSHIGFNRDQ